MRKALGIKIKKHVKLLRHTIYSIPKIHDTHCRDIISACMEMSSSLHAEYASDHEHVLGSILCMAKHEPDSPLPSTLQRHNTENSKQLFSEKELRGLSPHFHLYVSLSDLYIPTIGQPILLQKNMWTNPGNIYIAHRRMNVEVGTGARNFFSGNT
jgi:hypothetical protein